MSSGSKVLALLAASAVMLFASFSTAQAVEFSWEVDYLGEDCVNRSPSVTPYYFSGAIGNPSTTAWLELDCPMSRAAQFDSGTVDVIDQNGYTGYDVSCSHVGVHWNYNTATYYTGGSRASSGAGTQKQTLYFNGIANAPWPTMYYYSCIIPPAYGGAKAKSYIEIYTLSEPNP